MKRCPFCKSNDTGPAQHRRDCWTIMCFNCDAEGPPAPTRGEAIEKWEARAEAPAEVGSMA